MTDFETPPAGTADLVKRLRSDTPNMAIGHAAMRHAADRIEQLEAALTRANAATAAAYEVAALAIMEKCHDDMDREEEAAIVRALATPDQTAALDRLIAEAEARVWEQAVQIVADFPLGGDGPVGNDRVVWALENVRNAILAASKKGGA